MAAFFAAHPWQDGVGAASAERVCGPAAAREYRGATLLPFYPAGNHDTPKLSSNAHNVFSVRIWRSSSVGPRAFGM